ncbi:MAG: T9SS type A sorting domain-containing protein [Bacteroidetes bacterium]|nr:T9SS type A sorting domain-containing protein [Bacteroidota bacterium]
MIKSIIKKLLLLCFILFYSSGYAQENWKRQYPPTDKLLRHVFFVNNDTGWCAGAEGIIFHTTDGGKNWTEQNSTVNTFIVDLFFLNENLGWALTLRNTLPFGTTILKTTNGGMDWVATDYPENNVFMNVIFYFDSLNGWLGGSKIVSTSDGGLNWIDVAIDSGLVSNLPVLNFNFYNRQFGYACGGFIDLAGVIWRTTDYGLNWSSVGISPDQIFDMFVFDSLNAITLSGDPEGFFGIGDIKTTDAGENWRFDELPFFALSFAIDFRTDTEGWSASGPKFLFTSDRGETWVEKLTPDSAVIFDLTFTDSTTGYAVGENGLILKYKQNTTKVEDNINLPEKIVLHQNFPNPFNPGTSIQYAVSSRQFISLKIYDVLGNEIAVLVNEEKPAGEYEVKFSANGGGKGLTSGIYFYQLRIGSVIQTKKMVYLK